MGERLKCEDSPMIYGLYQSAQGAEAQSFRQDVIANNLANASTNAFKRDLAVFQVHPPFDVENGASGEVPGNLNDMPGGISIADVVTDYRSGPMITTGNRLDIALAGPGFFKVTDGQQEFLTRNGGLTLDGDGRILTEGTGLQVAGLKPVPENTTEIEVSTTGEFVALTTAGQRASLGRLQVVQPESYEALTKIGNSLFQTNSRLIPAGNEVSVKQGIVEGSGTQPVIEMMELIESSRAFESNVNMIKYQDEALGRLLQSAAR